MTENDTFATRVYAVVAQIPYGRVVSYGQIARMLGAPQSARQVGWAMRRCPDELPWQRVVRADGSVAGGGHAALRRALLEGEGIVFDPSGRVDMERHRWRADAGCGTSGGARSRTSTGSGGRI